MVTAFVLYSFSFLEAAFEIAVNTNYTPGLKDT